MKRNFGQTALTLIMSGYINKQTMDSRGTGNRNYFKYISLCFLLEAFLFYIYIYGFN